MEVTSNGVTRGRQPSFTYAFRIRTTSLLRRACRTSASATMKNPSRPSDLPVRPSVGGGRSARPAGKSVKQLKLKARPQLKESDRKQIILEQQRLKIYDPRACLAVLKKIALSEIVPPLRHSLPWPTEANDASSYFASPCGSSSHGVIYAGKTRRFTTTSLLAEAVDQNRRLGQTEELFPPAGESKLNQRANDLGSDGEVDRLRIIIHQQAMPDRMLTSVQCLCV
ncbi:unnamed protein product [Soboliphyme baturini]|uniref:Uncharacterized protein n=1 Tax=Soboliphyme baturini TaxID=241478 RepID=A0A183ID88_9BILA|nr:unnamed protein product [Soboliphyme baturini]